MVSYHLSPHRDVVFTSPIPLLHLPSYYKANRFQEQYHSNYNISYMCHKYAILNTVDFSAIQTYNRLWINLCTHKMTLKLLSVPSGQPCLLRSGAVFLFSFHGLLSKHLSGREREKRRERERRMQRGKREGKKNKRERVRKELEEGKAQERREKGKGVKAEH